MKRRTFIGRVLGAMTVVFSFPSWSRKTCYTGQDVEGPFHRADAPLRMDLSERYMGSGKQLIVRGKVYQSDCKTPLAGVMIDLWHASPNGAYDMSSDQYLFRGRLKTNENGFYEYKTLMPKGYKDGPLDRPRHIHYKVSAPGHKNLTTQLYFAGDPKLAGDPFVVQNNGLERAVNMKANRSGELETTFDIYLKAD